ncbi:hypothetical protein F4814DRAFT_447743 [Daldinia grandis]|nr:hypothetical protein F4814DRAFT_447743 [Daldinia grandis]
MLPSDSSVVFKESTCFSENGPNSSLPSPAIVRATQKSRHLSRSMTPCASGQSAAFGLTKYLFLKCMELIQGETLENKWESLSKPERIDVCGQLRVILSELRSLKQDPENQFLGHINRQPLLDIMFTDETKPSAGPFSSVKKFHDWLSFLTKRGLEIHWPHPSLIPDSFRDSLPDNSLITFTHADLHPSNILVTSDAPYRVMTLGASMPNLLDVNNSSTSFVSAISK